MKRKPEQPVNKCPKCGKRAFTLYCDNCAPPMITWTADQTGFKQRVSDRRWNGTPLSNGGISLPDYDDMVVASVSSYDNHSCHAMNAE